MIHYFKESKADGSIEKIEEDVARKTIENNYKNAEEVIRTASVIRCVFSIIYVCR